jgi:hypothetical protein
MESLPWLHLQPGQIDSVTAIKLDVTLWEILAHHSNQADRTEKTRRDRSVAGRPTEQARVFGVGRFNRIQGG